MVSFICVVVSLREGEKSVVGDSVLGVGAVGCSSKVEKLTCSGFCRYVFTYCEQLA